MNIDFTISKEGSIQNLIFIDESQYEEYPSTPILSVKFPSLSQQFEILIIPQQLNIITTQKLCYDKNIIDFPDGLYTIRYSVAPNDYKYKEKFYLRLNKTRDKINNLLLDKPDVNKYYEMEVYLKSAEFAAEKGNKDKAIEIFQNIQKQINKISCAALVE